MYFFIETSAILDHSEQTFYTVGQELLEGARDLNMEKKIEEFRKLLSPPHYAAPEEEILDYFDSFINWLCVEHGCTIPDWSYHSL